ncbi:MAG TPA: RsmD family RNA methyltransferase [Myxococcota bacterium]
MSRDPRRALPGRPWSAPSPSAPGPEATLELVVEALVPGGRGMARDDDGIVFVAGTAVGDRVKVGITGRRGGVREARVLDIVTSSPDRAASRDCVVADRCGGCDWLHLSPTAQAAGKHAVASDALRRIARFADAEVARFLRPLVSSTTASPALPASITGRRRTRVVVGRDGGASYSAASSHDRVDVTTCAALHPVLDAVLAKLPAARLQPGTTVRLAVDDRGAVVAATTTPAAAKVLVAAGVAGGAVVPDHKDESRNAVVVGDPLLVGEITAGRFAAVADAATFAQATRFGGTAITDAVMAGVDDVIDGACVLELFCGSGHLTLPLAARAAGVHGVEGDRRALRHLEHNRQLVKSPIVAEAAFIDAAYDFAGVNGGRTGVVVVDPPRTGIVGARAMFQALATQTKTTRLVMVSCDPATGARDLRAAVDAGFTLTSVTPIDAFPRTHHLEWVAVLAR